jgi:hypothetical protein
MTNLDHLDRLARAAGYAAVPEDDDAPLLLKPASVRFATPDAPAPRAAVAVTSSTAANLGRSNQLVSDAAAATRTAMTFYVGTAIKTAQTLVVGRRATV